MTDARRRIARWWASWRCFFDVHELRCDTTPVNGVLWAFCKHCGSRFEGTYDMLYGETVWKHR
jgi:RimJ/RimL family protein N-acetyltransferase